MMNRDAPTVETPQADRAAPEFAALSFASGQLAGSRAQPLPAVIVPVRSYDGETAQQALERQGISASQPGPELIFIRLE